MLIYAKQLFQFFYPFAFWGKDCSPFGRLGRTNKNAVHACICGSLAIANSIIADHDRFIRCVSILSQQSIEHWRWFLYARFAGDKDSVKEII